MRNNSRKSLRVAQSMALLVLSLAMAASFAKVTHVAVAANFTDAAKTLARVFKQETGHEAVLSFGATGQLYTQITQGAPFEILLAADNQRPYLAVQQGYGVADSVFTYAIGQLVLYSAEDGLDLNADFLKKGSFKKIALANPETAPYGQAAIETLNSLALYPQLEEKFILGQNIAQVFQFVETGNAELGFVALGQVSPNDQGSRWVVPAEFYRPIKQDAVLLKQGENNPAALALMGFLKSDIAAEIIQRYGYAVMQ